MDSVSNNTEMWEVTQYSRTAENPMIEKQTNVCIHANKMVSGNGCRIACTPVSASESASCAGAAVKVSMKMTDMIIREQALKP